MVQKKYILNEIDIVYRPLKELSQRPQITCASDAYRLFRENWDDMKIGIVEQFKIMHLNRANRVLGISNISSGGIAGTFVDQKLIFVAALKAGASSIILAHNHPSGNVMPSIEDEKLTDMIENSGKIIGISVLDHIILSGIDNKYYSIKDEGGVIEIDMPNPF